jgi:hypothetical protein
MYSATMHQLTFGFDRIRNALVFSGKLENGFEFEVCFPIGHVTLTFDREAAQLGYLGEPICGAIDTVDGFLGNLEVLGALPPLRGGPFDAVKAIVPAANRAKAYAAEDRLHRALNQQELYQFGAKPPAGLLKQAYESTIKTVGTQAARVAAKGAQAVSRAGMAVARSKLVGTALSGVAVAFPAVGAPALAAWGAANRAVATYDAARRGVQGAQHALQTLQSNVKQLSSSNAPVARMAIAGLHSYRLAG